MNSLQILKENGFIPISDLNYCTHSGIEYYIGFKDKGTHAGVVAMLYDEEINFITKKDLQQMSQDAKHYGVKTVDLFTNYGIELHSRLESPKTVGFHRIEKIISLTF